MYCGLSLEDAEYYRGDEGIKRVFRGIWGEYFYSEILSSFLVEGSFDGVR